MLLFIHLFSSLSLFLSLRENSSRRFFLLFFFQSVAPRGKYGQLRPIIYITFPSPWSTVSRSGSTNEITTRGQLLDDDERTTVE